MFIKKLLTLRELQNNLHLTRAELENMQQKKLAALIKHAYASVPYYRELFDSVNLKPDDITSVSDLKSIPITDKTIMRDLPVKDKVAKNIDIEKCIKIFTSGSTGMPSHLYVTQQDFNVLDLVYLRSFLVNGLKFELDLAYA